MKTILLKLTTPFHIIGYRCQALRRIKVAGAEDCGLRRDYSQQRRAWQGFQD